MTQQLRQTPVCVPVQEGKRYARIAVRGMNFDGATLTMDIQGEGFAYARLTFHDVIGFRVLDERDLTEFWNTYSEPNGWLWEVKSGGWLELERTRAAFNSHEVVRGLREFFVVDDKCVNVFSRHAPAVVDVGAKPPIG